MSRIARIALIATLAGTPVLIPASESGAVTLDKRRGAGAYSIGWRAIVQGTSWANLPTSALFPLTEGTTAPGDYVVDFSVFNTHATQTMYLLLRAHDNEDVSRAYPLGPGEQLAMTDIIWAANGNNITSFAFRGSGAGTTALVVATLSRGQVGGN